jgi:ABC-2 type transport system permease protein
MRGVAEHFERNITKYWRSKMFLISSLAMPAAWLVFVGLALPTNFTDSYLNFITPGILVMTVLSTSLSGGSLLVYDKMLGYLNKFLALPAPRESILYGKVLYVLTKGVIQATILIVFAVMLGATIFGPVNILFTYFVLVVFGTVFTTLGTTIGLLIDDLDNYSSVTQLVTMPLFFTSSALMPYDQMPSWLRTIAELNPVSYAIDSLRMAYSGNYWSWGMVILGFLSIVFVILCSYIFRKVTV